MRSTDLDFTGSTAVVTGGSKAMSLAIAECLAGEGAAVATYLASRRNCYVTGATVNVDGGSDFI
jgi:3-oxoacyl-[acyl-carrier protein] reductase